MTMRGKTPRTARRRSPLPCRSLKKPFADAGERIWPTNDYIVGNRFTAADLNIAEVLRYAQTQQALFDAHPNIERLDQALPVPTGLYGHAGDALARSRSDQARAAGLPAISSRIQALKSLTFLGSRDLRP